MSKTGEELDWQITDKVVPSREYLYPRRAGAKRKSADAVAVTTGGAGASRPGAKRKNASAASVSLFEDQSRIVLELLDLVALKRYVKHFRIRADTANSKKADLINAINEHWKRYPTFEVDFTESFLDRLRADSRSKPQ